MQREFGWWERPVGWVLFRNAGMGAASRRPAANGFLEAEVSEVEGKKKKKKKKKKFFFSFGTM